MRRATPQCDFGEALVVIGGVERKAHCFVKAYPAETTEAFCDGHVSAFAFLRSVPQSILYDNTRLAVAKILGDGRRRRTRAFTELQSHYLFEDRFGSPGKGNDKGKVEGLVGYVRRNFLVPVPSFESFDALNAYLERRCLERMDRKLRGHMETIGQRMERDLDALLPLPPVAYDACEKQAGRVSSLSLVRYKTNDYSVPVAYGYRDVLVRGYVDRELIDGTVLVSHSSFDRQALERAAEKYGLEMPRVRWLDSGMVARRAWPDKYGKNGWGLKQIAADLGIEFQHHEAGDDARVSAEIVLHACRHTGLDVGDWLEQAGHPKGNGGARSRQTAQPDRRLKPRGRKPAPKAQPQWAKSLAMILTLEEHRGLSDRAVPGGIDRFIQRWAEEITRDLGETGRYRLLLNILYSGLNHEERRRWVSGWRALLGRWNPQRRG